ncbi:hypothetical protein SHO565_77970 [Streptomyces sp. HO565]
MRARAGRRAGLLHADEQVLARRPVDHVIVARHSFVVGHVREKRGDGRVALGAQGDDDVRCQLLVLGEPEGLVGGASSSLSAGSTRSAWGVCSWSGLPPFLKVAV